MLPKPAKIDVSSLRASFQKVPWAHSGRINVVVGNIVEATLPGAQLGYLARIHVPGSDAILAEVVGFKDQSVLLYPFHSLEGVYPGCSVSIDKSSRDIPVGDFMVGKVMDSFCQSLGKDQLIIPAKCTYRKIDNNAPNPLERNRIKHPISLGIRAIDSTLTMGLGQRIGVMAGSGVGKSVLMGMIARSSSADINVIALIGERGREVREFIEKDLGPEGLARSVVIAVTSDQSPLMRIRGAKVATTIAEYFSSQGKNVLLMMDSVTRVAMAQREIGNAIGEPPTTKGYTPSVFSLLPKLLERTGPQIDGHGSISALYTVLVDGDDFNDPIADAVRSILDGHINLSRQYAARGHFPAIDIQTSASRVMLDIVSKEHWRLAQILRELLAIYYDNLDLVQIGAYQHGTNPKLDYALQIMPHIDNFLRQDIDDISDINKSLNHLKSIFEDQDQG